jgi:hypothetical protein
MQTIHDKHQPVISLSRDAFSCSDNNAALIPPFHHCWIVVCQKCPESLLSSVEKPLFSRDLQRDAYK